MHQSAKASQHEGIFLGVFVRASSLGGPLAPPGETVTNQPNVASAALSWVCGINLSTKMTLTPCGDLSKRTQSWKKWCFVGLFGVFGVHSCAEMMLADRRNLISKSCQNRLVFELLRHTANFKTWRSSSVMTTAVHHHHDDFASVDLLRVRGVHSCAKMMLATRRNPILKSRQMGLLLSFHDSFKAMAVLRPCVWQWAWTTGLGRWVNGNESGAFGLGWQVKGSGVNGNSLAFMVWNDADHDQTRQLDVSQMISCCWCCLNQPDKILLCWQRRLVIEFDQCLLHHWLQIKGRHWKGTLTEWCIPCQWNRCFGWCFDCCLALACPNFCLTFTLLAQC